MKKIILFIFILVSQLLAQPDFIIERDIIQSGKFFNSEISFFPSNKDYSIYYSYKISYSQLFFEKKTDLFIAGFRVNIEIKDSAGNLIKRAFDDRKISAENFNITNSPNTFLQGIISFSLPEGKYEVLAIISDQFSKRERRIPPIDLDIKKSKFILNPIVLNPQNIICDGLESYVLSNSSASIPYNKPNDYLAIPVTNSKINSLNLSVRRGDTVFIADEKITESFLANPEIKLCNENVAISRSIDSAGVKICFTKNISSKLSEGPIQIEVYPDDLVSEKQVYNLNVIWIGKPISLSDPEAAIRFIEIIESKDVVSDILSGSGSYSEKLFNYWKKQDPTPETQFNELMNEFYTRVDYCEMNFKALSGNGGAKSDRGKTYITFGPPDLIVRDTDNQDKVLEKWTYKKSNRRFIFIDSDGTGKFTLANGQ